MTRGIVRLEWALAGALLALVLGVGPAVSHAESATAETPTAETPTAGEREAERRAALERMAGLRLALLQAESEEPPDNTNPGDEVPEEPDDVAAEEDEAEPMESRDFEESGPEEDAESRGPTRGERSRELTPEQRRKIEELRALRDRLRANTGNADRPTNRRQPAQRREAQRPTPQQREAVQRAAPDTSEASTTVVDAPDPTAAVAGDGENWFQYHERAWEDVVRDFARRLGKPLMNAEELIIGGTLTYKSERKFTKQEAIDELNFLLHEKGYHFVEERDRIRVVPIMEMPQYVPMSMVFETVQEYRDANLRPMEYAIVYAEVEGRNAEEVVDLLGINLTDKIFIEVFGDTNKIKLSGVAKDIDRFLTLMNRVETDATDPRQTKFFPIKTNVRTIEQMVRSFFGAGQPRRRFNRETRRWETVGGDAGIQITADERTNTLIVRALPEDLEQIQEFLEEIDNRPDIGDFKTEVKKIQYASANEVAKILSQIFQVEQGQSVNPADAARLRAIQARRAAQARAAARRRGGNRNQANQQPTTVSGGATPEELIGEGVFERAKRTIRIAVIERTNSIAVYANEEGQQRVDEMLADIDQPQPTNLQTFTLEHVDVNEIAPMVQQLADELASQIGSSRDPAIVPDVGNNALHVMVDGGLLSNIEDIISRLDVEPADRSRHVVQLNNVRPSEMMQVIQAAMGESAAPTTTRRFRGRLRRTATPATTGGLQMIPLDASQTLVVICTDEEWGEIQELIEITDSQADLNTPQLRTFEVEQGDASEIAQVLGQFYRRYERPPFRPTAVLVHAENDTIFVQAVAPALEEIEALIKSMDVAAPIDDVRILPLQHADAAQVANQVQAFIDTGRRRRDPNDPIVQAEPVTNSLIVRADQRALERIERFALQIDEKVGAEAPEQKFFTLKYAQPREVAQAVQSMFTSGGTRGSRRRGMPVGTRVNAVASGKQVIVNAPQSVLPEIEQFIMQLDDPKGGEVVIETIKLAGADVANIAAKLTQAFRVKAQNQAIVARFDADPSSETILLTASRDVLDEAKALIAEYEAAYKGLITQVEFVTLQHAKADQASRWLSDQLEAWMERQYGRNAARQLRVTHQGDTNRVIINAPQVAVEHGKSLLAQYDQKPDAPGPSPIRTETYKLPGLDVNALSRTLRDTFRNRPRRPDRLEASFQAEQITETLVVSAPTDMFDEIEKLVNTFKEETADLTPTREFVQIENADANYIASQLRSLLVRQIRETRGRNVAERLAFTPDNRLNRVIIDAPKFVIPMALGLIDQLDQAMTVQQELIHTITLENADAEAVSRVLNDVLRQRMRTKRDLSITVEPMTNSLIVTADQNDWQEIEKWATELDAKALDRVTEPEVFPIEQANPYEVYNVLRATFNRRGYGRRRDDEPSFSVLGGKNVVVQASSEQMDEIRKLIAKLDSAGQEEQLEYRVYEFPGVGDNLNQFARQVQDAVNTKVRDERGRQAENVRVDAVTAADALIVTAKPSQFEEITAMFEKFKPLWEQQSTQTVFLELKHVDANRVVRQVQELVTSLVARERGRRATRDLSVASEPRTNRLIVTAPESIFPRVREVVANLDVPSEDDRGQIRTVSLANADARQLERVLDQMYRNVNRDRRDDRSHIPIQIEAEPITNSLLVRASDEFFEEIATKANEIDEASIVRQTEPQLYNLQHADPWQLRNAIFEAYRETGRGWGTRRNEEQDVQVTVVGRNLLVQAPQDKLTRIEKLIEELDTPDSREGKLRVVKLTNADASAVASSLEPLAREKNRAQRRNPAYTPIQIVPETVTNALYVIAGDEDFNEIESEVARIDDEAADIDITPMTIRLENADPREVSQAIERMFGERRRGRRNQGAAPLEVTVASNTIVVKAPEKQLAAIRSLVSEIEANYEDNDLSVETFTLQTLNAQQVAMQVNAYLLSISSNWPRGSARPAAFAEPTTNTLVVMAPADTMPFVKGLLAKLETMQVPTAELRRYALENASAEQVQPSVDALLQAKVQERAAGGRQQVAQISVVANARSNEVVVFGPPEYQQLAEELITMLDQSGEGERIHIITLEDADAVEMADTLNEIIGGGGGGNFRRFFRRFRGRGGTTAGGDEIDVQIVADAQTNSLILKGRTPDVAAVESLIEDLRSRGTQVPELQIFTLENVDPTTAVEALQTVYQAAPGQEQQVSFTIDDFSGRVFVTAPRRQLSEIADRIEQMDAGTEESSIFGPGGRKPTFVEIYKGDAWDIAWEIQGLLPLDSPIVVEPDWFGEYIKVVGNEQQVEEITELIREVESRQRVEKTQVLVQLRGNVQRTLQFLRERNPDAVYKQGSTGRRESLIIDVWGENEEPPIKQRRESEQAARRTSIRPVVLDFVALTELEAVIAQAERNTAAADGATRGNQDAGDDTAADNATAADDSEAAPPAADDAADGAAEEGAAAQPQREQPEVTILDDGRLLITGPVTGVQDLVDSIELIQEDLKVGEVIRVFRFRYGNVNTAAEVIDRMFNDRAARIRNLRAQQQQQQQQPRGQQQGQQGEDGQQGQPPQQPDRRQPTPQAPETRVRVATDPTRNYLIVKCDESDLPDIVELLKILDDVPAVDVKVQIFELVNLDAEETADNIKTVLGIEDAGRRGGATRRGGRRSQELVTQLEEQVSVSVAGAEGVGAQIESVQVVPNTATNSLMVAAPPEVMDVISGVLTDLQLVEPQGKTVIREFELRNAEVRDILGLLQEIFANVGERGGAASPAELGPVSISADPRRNTIIYVAQAKDVPVVERQIQLLDVEGNTKDVRTYVVQYGDAVGIANVVQEIYALQEGVATNGNQRGSRRGGQGAMTGLDGMEVRIVPEPATNSIVVWAPVTEIDEIIERIETFDLQARREYREIDLQYADADQLAQTLSQMFGGSAATTLGQDQSNLPWWARERRQQNVSAGGGVVIVGDKKTKKLLVQAPEPVFEQIQEMVSVLDVQNKNFDFRRYNLQHAKAGVVKSMLDQAVQEFIQIGFFTDSQADLDSFTVVADERTNSLLVAGSPEAFAVVEQVLLVTDVPTPESQRKVFRAFTLLQADAEIVAQAINNLAAGGGGGMQAGRRGGGRFGMFFGGGGGAAATAGELDVQAMAEPSTNSVLVLGPADDIDEVEMIVIEPFENELGERFVPETVTVSNAKPSQVASFVRQMLNAGGMDGADAAGAPQLIPVDGNNTIVVSGPPAQRRRVRRLIEQFDDASLVSSQVLVRKIPRTLDVAALAPTVERSVNESEQLLAQQQSREPNLVVISAQDETNTLVITGEPSAFGMANQIIDQIIEAGGATGVVTRVIELDRITSQDAIRLIQELQQNRGGQNRSGTRRASPQRSNRRGGRRGSWLWNSPQQPHRQRVEETPVASRSPQLTRGGSRVVSTVLLTPLILLAAPDAASAQSTANAAAADEAARSVSVDDSYGRDVATEAAEGVGVTQQPAAARSVTGSNNGRALRTGGGRLVLVSANAEERARALTAAERLQALRERLKQRRAALAARETAAPAADAEPVADNKTPAEEAGSDRDGVLLAANDEPTPPRNEQPRRARATANAGDSEVEDESANAADVVVSAETDAPPAGTEVSPGVLSGELLGDVEAAEVDGNRIILQGAESDIEFLIALLRSMEASAPISELRVLTLENAKATALVDIVQEAVQSLVDARTGGQPGAADRFSITAEARSNSLIVAASEENLADIVRIVEQLDRSGDRDVQFELVPLQHVRAADAATQLRPVIERLNAVREIPAEVQPSIEANERANSILVIGTPSEIDEITRLVNAVDVPLEPEDRGSQFGTVSEMLIVNLKNNTAEAVAELLNSLIEAEQERARTALTGEAAAPVVRQLQLKTPGGEELPPLDLEKPIRLIPDDGTNSLLVYSTPENNTALVDIISTFDAQPIGVDMDVKAFQLQHASAEQVAEILEEVFEESEATLLRPAERGESFDEGVMPPVPPGLAARGLPYRVAISFDTRSNTVFVVGREPAVILAGGLIKEMDQSSSSLALRPRVIELKAVQASQMAETLEELLDERQEVLGGDQGAARDVAVIQPLERSNALIVIATDDVFEMIDDMIFQLDSADSYRVIATEYVPLEAADALKIQTLLTEVFDAKEEAEGAVQEDSIDSLTITADPRTNALLLTGTRDYINEATQLIAQFDREFGPTVAFELFQVKLNSAQNIASRLQDMIEAAFADEESNLSGQPIHIDYDPVTDGVLVAAAPEDLQSVARWIEILDQPSRFDPMTAIVPLARADAEEVAETATEIFGEAGDDTFVVTIRPDTASNAVVVKAPPAVLNDIRNFVTKLDGVEPGSAAVVKIFKLDKADAEEAGELLNNILAGEGGAVGGDGGDAAREEALRKVMLIYQRDADVPPVRAFRDEIVVTAVVRTNSLVVQAPSSAFPLVESLVTAIDVPPDAARIRIFTLRNSDAEQMVETLEQLFEERIEDDETGRELTLGSPLGIGGRQEVSFAADTRTNSVIAAGTPGYLDVVEEFVVELDSQPIEERKTIVYDPRYLPPQSIVDSFSEFSEAEQSLLDELAEDVSAQRRLEREIIAILNEDEEAGNKVILSFDPRREPEVMEILRQLDQAPPQVNIEVLILEVNLNNSLELGIEFAAQDLQYTAAGVNDTTTFDYVYGTDIGAAGSGLGGFSFTITGRDFNFLLRTLQTESDVRVLSRPSITVMDNKEATFENIERFPFITSSTVTDGGNTITSVDREPVGITLTVTPQINPDGYVRLAVEQEISSITDSNVVIDNVVQPITFERVTNTTINVKDSETVVLGGLITDRQTRTENKIPLLGDIPIIGRLFRYENDETSRSELLVVLTPRIINTVDDYRGISIAQRDAGYISPETKASPLMNDLRVPLPDEQDELPGEVETLEDPTRPAPSPRPKPRRPADTYGPLNDLEAVRAELRPAPAATDERETYRVPLGRRN